MKSIVKGGIATWLQNQANRQLAAAHITQARKNLGRAINEPQDIHLAKLSGVCTGASGVPVSAWREVFTDAYLDLDKWVAERQPASPPESAYERLFGQVFEYIEAIDTNNAIRRENALAALRKAMSK